MEDSDILDLLRQLQDTDKQSKAWDALQPYHAEALMLAIIYSDLERKEKLNEARETLKKRLRQLLR